MLFLLLFENGHIQLDGNTSRSCVTPAQLQVCRKSKQRLFKEQESAEKPNSSAEYAQERALRAY